MKFNYNKSFPSKSLVERKDKGIYYTPEYITEYICKKALLAKLSQDVNAQSLKAFLNENKHNLNVLEKKVNSLKILDPSCGGGAFLSKMVEILFKFHLKLNALKGTFIRKENQNKELKNKILSNNIFGVDLNQNCTLSKEASIKSGNALITDQSYIKNAFPWEEEFKEVLDGGGFDIIIGNPPWGANLEGFKEYLEKEYEGISVGQYDSFGLFLYQNIRDLLKTGGILGYVVPNELCLIETYESLRSFLLRYELLELINLGFDIFPEVNKPSLILFLRKEEIEKYQNKNSRNPSSKSVKIITGLSESEKSLLKNAKANLKDLVIDKAYYRSQMDFASNKEAIFDIFSTKEDWQIKEIINKKNFRPLKHYFFNGRGIDTNKSGTHYICPKCGLLNPPFGRGHSGRIQRKKCQANTCDFFFEKKDKNLYEITTLISDKDYPEPDFNAPGYIGEDLHKLHFNRNPRAFKYFGDKIFGDMHTNQEYYKYSKISWGKDELYRGDKLLIRKVSTGHNLQVMIYKDYLITNQQIYIFKKKKKVDHISLLYFLGILVSRLIHYYYIKEFGDPEKNILPHFTQAKIKALPIPEPDVKSEDYKKIITCVQNLLDLVKKYQQEKGDPKRNLSNHKQKLSGNKKYSIEQKIKKNYKNLDDLILDSYNISSTPLRSRIISEANKNGFEML
ncbi:MAG: hypothetical protein BAJALOKI2v1_420015 [Promethearchaeota archaeon]|nr:MAG: hypothetical protein BAJALOKI2v1_420015 [Candidatus Lokiarchaeota archaeon]